MLGFLAHVCHWTHRLKHAPSLLTVLVVLTKVATPVVMFNLGERAVVGVVLITIW